MRILVDLRKWLDDTATKIANDNPNPMRWGTALLYLMEASKSETDGREYDVPAYEKVLQKVRDSLTYRIKDQSWVY